MLVRGSGRWAKLRSTNPLERVNREIGRRTDVVGIFPNDRSLIRLAASVVIEQNDEWLVGPRTSALTRWKPSSIRKENKTTTERRPASSRRPEQPTKRADEFHHVLGLDSARKPGRKARQSFCTPRARIRRSWLARFSSR
jgi:hypothetical protein